LQARQKIRRIAVDSEARLEQWRRQHEQRQGQEDDGAGDGERMGEQALKKRALQAGGVRSAAAAPCTKSLSAGVRKRHR
jgi:hypothetical protein